MWSIKLGVWGQEWHWRMTGSLRNKSTMRLRDKDCPWLTIITPLTPFHNSLHAWTIGLLKIKFKKRLSKIQRSLNQCSPCLSQTFKRWLDATLLLTSYLTTGLLKERYVTLRYVTLSYVSKLLHINTVYVIDIAPRVPRIKKIHY